MDSNILLSKLTFLTGLALLPSLALGSGQEYAAEIAAFESLHAETLTRVQLTYSGLNVVSPATVPDPNPQMSPAEKEILDRLRNGARDTLELNYHGGRTTSVTRYFQTTFDAPYQSDFWRHGEIRLMSRPDTNQAVLSEDDDAWRKLITIELGAYAPLRGAPYLITIRGPVDTADRAALPHDWSSFSAYYFAEMPLTYAPKDNTSFIATGRSVLYGFEFEAQFERLNGVARPTDAVYLFPSGQTAVIRADYGRPEFPSVITQYTLNKFLPDGALSSEFTASLIHLAISEQAPEYEPALGKQNTLRHIERGLHFDILESGFLRVIYEP